MGYLRVYLGPTPARRTVLATDGPPAPRQRGALSWLGVCSIENDNVGEASGQLQGCSTHGACSATGYDGSASA